MRQAAMNPAAANAAHPAERLAGPRGRGMLRGYWCGTLVLLAVAIILTIWYTPVHQQMGPVQKIFYFHLSVAINTFLACLTTFVAGLGYLWQRDDRWDALSESGARAAVALCAVVLLTGVIWAKQAWGVWWEWSSPLTFSLFLWLLYVGYFVTRRWLVSPAHRAGVSAVYGIVAFLDVPLVYVSVKVLPEQHPTSMDLNGPMQVTLVAWMLAVTLLTIGLIGTRYSLARKLAGAERAG